jgi:predicted nuclease of restriction endonuclease-like RecB superfamily
LLRQGDLPLRVIDRSAFFDFLGPQDEPWLRVLLAEVARFEGRRRRELAERLAEPLPCEAPYLKRRAATQVLLRLWRRERAYAVPPVEARAKLFRAAAVLPADDAPFALAREATLTSVAATFGVEAAALDESLFADLPGEQLVRAPDPPPSPSELALRTNLALVQSALARASTIEIAVEGGVRPIVRLAKLRGLICAVVEAPDGSQRLQLSGPFSLFRHTLLYGRALAELLPHLAWCARFELRAVCSLWDRLVDVVVETGAPIFPATPPATFDSKLEERFARDVGKLAPDWDVVREPEAVRAGGTLIFPDFLLRHRLDPSRRVLVELAGFWTPYYLATKLARLREAQLGPFILCVDEDRVCALGEVPPNLSVLPFRRRVDAAALLRRVEELTDAASLPSAPDGLTLNS